MKLTRSIVVLTLLALVAVVVVLVRDRRTTHLMGDTRMPHQGSISTTSLANPDAFAKRYGLGANPKIFGPHWDSVPPLTLTGTNAMAGVNAFIATNGWDMSKTAVFTYGLIELKSVRGLPWKEIHNREYHAVTSGGILYVVLSSFSHIADGVAYNPKTNRFGEAITGFKPIGGHWYVWAQHEDPIQLPKEYE